MWSLLSAGLPFFVFAGVSMVLALIRPDVEGPMWTHIFGVVLVVVALILSWVAAGLTRLVFSFQRIAIRIALAVLIQAIASFAALFLALFAPIVFAIMFT